MSTFLVALLTLMGTADGTATTVYSWHGLGTVIANSPGAALTIVLGANLNDFEETITISLNSQVTIEGSGFYADASGKGQFFNVYGGGTLALNSLTLKNGNAQTSTTYSGGAVWVSAGAMLNINGTNFESNNAGQGGAIYNAGGTIAMEGSTFKSNCATQWGGGAIDNVKGSLNIKSTTFESNTAGQGGAIFNAHGSMTIDDNTVFQGNTCRDGPSCGNNIAAP
jgi:predicted outer membrane repeat protein